MNKEEMTQCQALNDGQKYNSILPPSTKLAAGLWNMQSAKYTERNRLQVYTKNILSKMTKQIWKSNREKCYIVDVNESEKQALDNLKGEDYEAIAEAVAAKDTTLEEKDATICSQHANEAKIEKSKLWNFRFCSKIAVDGFNLHFRNRGQAKESFNAQATIASMEATAADENFSTRCWKANFTQEGRWG